MQNIRKGLLQEMEDTATAEPPQLIAAINGSILHFSLSLRAWQLSLKAEVRLNEFIAHKSNRMNLNKAIRGR